MMRSGRSEGGEDTRMMVREPHGYQLDTEEQETFAIKQLPDNIKSFEKRSGKNSVEDIFICLNLVLLTRLSPKEVPGLLNLKGHPTHPTTLQLLSMKEASKSKSDFKGPYTCSANVDSKGENMG